jgi:glycosyltransferase involved in cell wall biosynthesis
MRLLSIRRIIFMRLALVTSHPVQYYTPLFRTLARHVDLMVFFAHRATGVDQAKAGFGVAFDWDIELLAGYDYKFLQNVATRPGLDHFLGCNTPEIASQLKARQFDAVVLQGWYLRSFIQALVAAKCQGLAVIARGDSHLDTPRSWLKRGIKSGVFPSFLKLFDAALYVGERSRSYWIRYGFPSTRLFFSPHCVDDGWFASRVTPNGRAELRARLGIRDQTKVVLFAGKLVPFKRPLDTIAACALLKAHERDICLLVAGAGPLEGEIMSAAQSAGICIKMLGFCNQTEMPQVYAASDVLVLPSDGHETWGLVANEALACGLPVALSDAVGSAIDLAADGSAGYVFTMADIAALAQAVGELLDNPRLPDAIAKKSAQYSVNRAVEGILQASEFVKDFRKRSQIFISYPR